MSVGRWDLIRWVSAFALFVAAQTTYQSIVPRLILASASNSGDAAELNSWAQGVQAAATLLFAPTVGSLSDKYGRPLLFAVHACALGVTTLAVALSLVNSAGWLVLSAVSGAVSCADFVSRAALSTGDEASKASVYGVLAGAGAVGSLVGMQVSGALASSAGAEVTLICGACMAFAAVLFACCLPDRRSPVIATAEKNDQEEVRPVPDQCIAAGDQGASLTMQRALDLAIGLDAFAGASFASLGVIYCTTQYDLGAEGYAQVLTIFSASSIAANFGLLPLLRRAFDSSRSSQTRGISQSDLLTGVCGLALWGCGFACCASGSLSLLFLAAVLAGCGAISSPGLIGARISATGSAAIRRHGGTMQGRIARIQGFSMAVAPLAFSAIYARVGPRTPFVVASIMEFATCVAVFSLYLMSRVPGNTVMTEALLGVPNGSPSAAV